MTLTLGAVLGGVLGNLYDRLNLHTLTWGRDWPLRGEHLPGEKIFAVRDWILVQWSDELRWPNFNIADALLVVGAAVLFFRALQQPAPETNEHD